MITPMHVSGRDFPYQWYIEVEEKPSGKFPGKRYTVWLNGSFDNREDVARHTAAAFPHVSVIAAHRAERAPEKMLQPVPAHFFEWGIRDKALGIVPMDEPRSGAIVAQRKPIALKPINLKPL